MDLAALEKSELFVRLDARALKAVKAGAQVKRIRAGSLLLKQGDGANHLFCVVSGRFKMTTVSKEGAEKTLRFMEPGDAIGCAAVFKGFPYPATATAVVDSESASWSAAQFQELMRNHPQIAANALAMVGERAEQMLQRVREVTSEPADRRIAKAVLRLLAQQKEKESGNGELHISGQELAELSDTTLFTVSRAIATWKRDGIVTGGRNRLHVTVPAKLMEIAGEG